MSAYRDDLDAARGRIECLELEKAQLEVQIQVMAEQIDELEDKDNARTNFYLSFTEDQVRQLEAENRTMHVQLDLLRRRMPCEVIAAAHALARIPNVDKEVREIRSVIRRYCMGVALLVIGYILVGSPL